MALAAAGWRSRNGVVAAAPGDAGSTDPADGTTLGGGVEAAGVFFDFFPMAAKVWENFFAVQGLRDSTDSKRALFRGAGWLGFTDT